MKKTFLAGLLVAFLSFLTLSSGDTQLEAAQKSMTSEGRMQSGSGAMVKENTP